MNEAFVKSLKLLLLLVVLYIVTFIIGVIVGSVFNNIEITKWVLVIGLMLLAVLFFGKRYVDLSFDRIERRMVWPAIGMSVLIAVAQLLITISVLSLLDVDYFYQGEELERRQQLITGIAGALFVIVSGPIIEEICFRGLLLDGLLKTRCHPWAAILISAVAFGLFHGLWAPFVTATLFGILAGWLYWRTGSIIPGLIIHITNNSLTGIDLINQTDIFYLIALVGGLIFLTYGVWWFWKNVKKCENF